MFYENTFLYLSLSPHPYVFIISCEATMCTGVSLEQWRAAVGVMAARAKVRQSKKPSHGKGPHGTRTQINHIRGKARRRRSARHKNKVNQRKTTRIYGKYTKNNAIQCTGKKWDSKTDQNEINERREGRWYIPWLSVLSLLFKFCGLDFVWHTIHCYVHPHKRTAAVSGKKEHKMKKQGPSQIAVGGLCVNRSTFLLLLSFLLVLVQMLLMLCGDVEPNPGPTPITMTQFRLVVEVLKPIQHKWLDLGKALHIPEQRLDILSWHCSPEICLSEMLHEWLKSEDSIFTWESLRDAVAAVGEQALSQSINHQYVVDVPQQGMMSYYYSVVSSSLTVHSLFLVWSLSFLSPLFSTLQKNDGYFNPYVRLSQLHLSIPGPIECAECVGDLLSNEAIEQLRKRELQVD